MLLKERDSSRKLCSLRSRYSETTVGQGKRERTWCRVESRERGSRTLAGDSGQVNFLTGEGQWESQLTRPGWANRQHPALNKSTNPTNNWNPAVQKARLRLYRIRIPLTADVVINHFQKPKLTEEMAISVQEIFVFESKYKSLHFLSLDVVTKLRLIKNAISVIIHLSCCRGLKQF